MRSPHRFQIAAWMPLSVVAFALAGSLLLLALFRHAAARDERATFDEMARANAAFLARSALPHSEKMAAQLGEILGASVWFETTQGPVGDVPPRLRGAPVSIGPARVVDGLLVAGHALAAPESAVFFAQPVLDAFAALRRADTWVALCGFWLLAGVLGIVLARRVTGPLGRFAAALPHLNEEGNLPWLPVTRGDEIGQLARRFVEERQALHEERERRRAAERLALLGRMAASLAHEVRNPLAAIKLHAQLLARAVPEAERESASLIENEAARIETLVAQWLHYARPTPPALVPVNLAILAVETLRLLTPQGAHTGVSFVCELPPSAFTTGDSDRLRQAIANLVLNAIQAMPRGGRLRLRLLSDSTHHRLVIEDEGAGFSPTAIDRAGEAFFSEREGGMGLGLTAAAETARAHGGCLLWQNRNDGAGARVTLELPALASGEDAQQDAP